MLEAFEEPKKYLKKGTKWVVIVKVVLNVINVGNASKNNCESCID